MKTAVQIAQEIKNHKPIDKTNVMYDETWEDYMRGRRMTYRELFYKAIRLIDNDKITLGEYDEMTKPLDREVEQEPRWISVSEKKPNKGGEYLLWGKIDESEEEDYCFIGDYYEFEEKFGTEISNYDPNTLGFIDTEIEEYYSVIAWMPLPKPYEAESEN